MLLSPIYNCSDFMKWPSNIHKYTFSPYLGIRANQDNLPCWFWLSSGTVHHLFGFLLHSYYWTDSPLLPGKIHLQKYSLFTQQCYKEILNKKVFIYYTFVNCIFKNYLEHLSLFISSRLLLFVKKEPFYFSRLFWK